MAIKINWQIVNSKGKIKKQKTIKKKLLTLEGQNVWIVKEGELWEGKVLSDENWIATVSAINKHYSQAWNSPEEIIVPSSLLNISKDVYEC